MELKGLAGCHGTALQACPASLANPPRRAHLLPLVSLVTTITDHNLDVLLYLIQKHDPVIECDNCCHLECARFSTNLSSLKTLLNVCHLNLITILGSRNY